jgi:hypothetical protein
MNSRATFVGFGIDYLCASEGDSWNPAGRRAEAHVGRFETLRKSTEVIDVQARAFCSGNRARINSPIGSTFGNSCPVYNKRKSKGGTGGLRTGDGFHNRDQRG